jgi:hypothetical protein
MYAMHVHFKSFFFQIKMLFLKKCMSSNKNAFSCPCEHAVEGILDHLGIQVPVCCYNCLTKFSKTIWSLIMWHIPNLMLQVAPKKKSHTVRSGERRGQGESPRLLISRRRPGNCPRRYRIAALPATSFPGSFLLWSKDPGRSWSRDP